MTWNTEDPYINGPSATPRPNKSLLRTIRAKELASDHHITRALLAAERGRSAEINPMHNPEAREAILEVVANQLQPGISPEVRVEYDRLIRNGITDAMARESIGLVLSLHVARMLKNHVDFDYLAYLADLRILPDCVLDRDLY
jgi:hypothetical protein